MKRIFKNIVSYLTNKIDEKSELNREWFELIGEFEEKIGYKFKNLSLLQAAFMHLSYFRKCETETKEVSSFERMEFLGDSILGLVVAEELFLKFPSSAEGKLSKLKSTVVSENT